MKIDTKMIQAELEGLGSTEKVKVKLDRSSDVAVSINQADCKKDKTFIPGFFIRLNPSRIRSPSKLGEILNFCRETVAN